MYKSMCKCARFLLYTIKPVIRNKLKHRPCTVERVLTTRVALSPFFYNIIPYN